MQPAGVNSDLWREPTWGDVQTVQGVVKALSPANAADLVSCLGSVSRGPVHVHRVRNAAAHRNLQTLADVRSLSIYYNATGIRHPLEVVTWTEPQSRDYAFVAWLEEMRLVADLMTI